jgi:hypothetical protein
VNPLRVVMVVIAVTLLALIVELVRRRHLPPKYAALWLVVGTGGVAVAAAPALLNATARRLHVYDPVNLLLFAAVVFLLLVCMHLSWECGRLEEETRTVAEQLALLRLELHGSVRDAAGIPAPRAREPLPAPRADGC